MYHSATDLVASLAPKKIVTCLVRTCRPDALAVQRLFRSAAVQFCDEAVPDPSLTHRTTDLANHDGDFMHWWW
jgi:hypothetical protein